MLRLLGDGAESRAAAQEWLWPASPAGQAAANLRKLMGRWQQDRWVDEAFDLGRDVLRVRPHVRVTLDPKRAATAGPASPEDGVGALTLFAGATDTWLDRCRAALRDAVRRTLSGWDPAQLAKVLPLLIQAAPTDDLWSIWQVRVAVAHGDYAAARTEVARFEAAVRRELDKPDEAYRTAVDAALRSSPLPYPTPKTPFVGCKEALAAALEWARGQNNLLVWIEGEAGSGKSQLVAEWLRRIQERLVPVVVLQCPPPGATVPYAPLIRALEGRPLDDLAPAWRHELGRLVPTLAPAGELPPPMRTGWRRDRFHYAVTRALLGPEPGVLVLEDAQWVDRGTLAWWRSLASSPWSRRLLQVVTTRPAANAGEQARLSALGEPWAATGRLRPIELGPLGAPAVQELAALAGVPEPYRTSPVLFGVSGGNALRLLAWAEDTKHHVSAEAVWDTGLARRIRRLSPRTLELVERLALWEHPHVSIQHLAKVLEREPTAVLNDGAKLAEQGLVAWGANETILFRTRKFVHTASAGSPPPGGRVTMQRRQRHWRGAATPPTSAWRLGTASRPACANTPMRCTSAPRRSRCSKA